MNFAEFPSTLEGDISAPAARMLGMQGRPPKVLKHYPNRIREVREAKGLTQQALAKLVPTSHQNIQKWELGGREVTLARLDQVARALKVPAHTLINGSDQAADEQERALIELFRRVPAERRSEVIRIISVLASSPETPAGQRRKAS